MTDRTATQRTEGSLPRVDGGFSMKLGRHFLNCVFGWSKLLALAAAIFLVSANLDNVPDCPELLNSSSSPSVSLQVAHLHIASSCADVTCTVAIVFRSAMSIEHCVSEGLVRASPFCVARSLHQATDPSPPLTS